MENRNKTRRTTELGKSPSWCSRVCNLSRVSCSFWKKWILISLHCRVGYNENASTADSTDASGKKWDLVSAHCRVCGTFSCLNAESAFSTGKLISLLHSLLSRWLSWLHHNRVGFYFWNLNAFKTWFLLFSLKWLDAIDGLIRSLSSINIISHKNPQKWLKNTMIHLFTHKLAMKYRNGTNTPKMILKCH